MADKEPDRKIDWDLFSRPGHLINRASRMMQRIGESRLRVLGIGVGQLPVLAVLKNGAALSQKELARVAKIEQPSMAQMLARMERDGLIQRIPDPADRRSSLIMLTEVAQSRLPAARKILIEGNDEALSGFSESEKETLAALLQRVIVNLEEMVKSSTEEAD